MQETHIPSEMCVGETCITDRKHVSLVMCVGKHASLGMCVQEAWYPGKHASLWDWFLSMDTTPLADVLWWVNTSAYYIRARVMANNKYSYVASYVKLSHKYSKATVWRACSWHVKIIILFAYILHQTVDVAVNSVHIIIMYLFSIHIRM